VPGGQTGRERMCGGALLLGLTQAGSKQPAAPPVFVVGVQNVNARGTIYSMWIILRKCEGGCEAPLVRSRPDLVGVLVLNYSKTGGR